MASRSTPFMPLKAAQIAATRRIELAQTFLPGSTVQAMFGIDASTLATWRKTKRLLAVWHELTGDWLYPDFQFNGRKQIDEIPGILAVFDRYYSHVWSNTWSIVEWFLSPHALLNGASPLDTLTTDPQRVLRVAELEFWQDPDTLW